MTNLTTVLVALGSVGVGSALTMLGQALADRRTKSRDREARREAFMAQNFDTQKEALLKVGELVNEIARCVSAEHRRKFDDGVYDYFDSKPTKRIGEAMMAAYAQISELRAPLESHEGPWSKDEIKAVECQVMQSSKDMPKIMKSITAEVDNINKYLLSDKVQEFLRSLVTMLEDLSLHVYRTGSETVVSAVRDYRNAALEYNSRLVTSDIEKFGRKEFQARNRVHEIVGRELKRGPFT